MMLQRILWLAVAGAAGTLARYWLSGVVQLFTGTGFPWGTLAVNGLGCFVFGLVWTMAEEQVKVVQLKSFEGSAASFVNVLSR